MQERFGTSLLFNSSGCPGLSLYSHFDSGKAPIFAVVVAPWNNSSSSFGLLVI